MATCDMKADCREPIAMLDTAGFVYCSNHGLYRRTFEPCRKLRPYEIRRIERGEQIKRY